jgi:hypothetical protein
MATMVRGTRGIHDFDISDNAGIAPFKLDRRYATTTAFLAAKAKNGRNVATAEKGDEFFDTTLNTPRYYDGSNWQSGSSALGATLTTGSIWIGAAGVAAELVAKTSGRVLIGDGTTAVLCAISGDATLASGGALTIGAKAIAASKMYSAARGVLFRGDASNVVSEFDAKTATKIVCGTGTDVDSVTMSGDISINNGVTAIGSGKVLSAMCEDSLIHYASITVTAAELHALKASPKTLVAASAGKVIQLVSATLFLDYGGAAAVCPNDNELLEIHWNNTAGAKVSNACLESFVEAAADSVTFLEPVTTALTVAKAGAENVPLVLCTNGTAEVTVVGVTSEIRVNVAYRLLSTGF